MDSAHYSVSPCADVQPVYLTANMCSSMILFQIVLFFRRIVVMERGWYQNALITVTGDPTGLGLGEW